MGSPDVTLPSGPRKEDYATRRIQTVLPTCNGRGGALHAMDHGSASGNDRRLNAIQRSAARGTEDVADAFVATP